jgi:hypothetical protein
MFQRPLLLEYWRITSVAKTTAVRAALKAAMNDLTFRSRKD